MAQRIVHALYIPLSLSLSPVSFKDHSKNALSAR